MAFRVLAMGDSIMWGQGNREDAKFVRLVCKWLEKDKRKGDVSLISLAHSGAIAAQKKGESRNAKWGEVPEAAPSVHAQLEASEKDVKADEIDVVLVNGGINDVSPLHIVVANPFVSDGKDAIKKATEDVFGETGAVRTLLTRTLERYSKAKVVVLGYYPIVSTETSARHLARLIRHLPRRGDLVSAVDRFVEGDADHVIEDLIRAEKDDMVSQCTAFHATSSKLLRETVEHLKTKDGEKDRHRIAFADPAFKPANAFAAKDTWLWSGSDDPLHLTRVFRYAWHAWRNPFDWPIYTPLASICHPNEAGAKAYAKAIAESLETLRV
jgi:lysophospholipase L1-like esterase